MMFVVNDLVAYGNLSGYKVKGAKACSICNDEMKKDLLTY